MRHSNFWWLIALLWAILIAVLSFVPVRADDDIHFKPTGEVVTYTAEQAICYLGVHTVCRDETEIHKCIRVKETECNELFGEPKVEESR